MSELEHSPTCGSPVTILSSHEGTHCYQPMPRGLLTHLQGHKIEMLQAEKEALTTALADTLAKMILLGQSAANVSAKIGYLATEVRSLIEEKNKLRCENDTLLAQLDDLSGRLSDAATVLLAVGDWKDALQGSLLVCYCPSCLGEMPL